MNQDKLKWLKRDGKSEYRHFRIEELKWSYDNYRWLWYYLRRSQCLKSRKTQKSSKCKSVQSKKWQNIFIVSVQSFHVIEMQIKAQLNASNRSWMFMSQELLNLSPKKISFHYIWNEQLMSTLASMVKKTTTSVRSIFKAYTECLHFSRRLSARIEPVLHCKAIVLPLLEPSREDSAASYLLFMENGMQSKSRNTGGRKCRPGVHNESGWLIEFCQEECIIMKIPFQTTQEKTLHGASQLVNIKTDWIWYSL